MMLPPEVVRHIYEFDPTYHEIFRKEVLPQMERFRIVSVRIIALALAPPMTDPQYRRAIKRIVRHSKKADLKSCLRFWGGKCPKRVTKHKLVLRIICSMFK